MFFSGGDFISRLFIGLPFWTISRETHKNIGSSNMAGRSTLLQVPEFKVTKCILHDLMRVLLQGLVVLEIQ